MNGLELLRVVIEGGILVGTIKALIHIGAVLQEIKSMKETQINHDTRIRAVESVLMMGRQ